MEVQFPETTTSRPNHGFFPIFFSVYLFGYFILFRRWRPELRREACSSLISLAHGTPVVFMATNAILASPPTPHTFASPNTPLHDSVLEFSIAYFSLDLMHYLLFFPGDVLFIAHHLGTLYVFFTCRYVVGHGAVGVLAILVLAEVTSPCQNVWSLARLRKAEVAAAARLCEYLSVPFYCLYTLVRGVLGPVLVYKLVDFYLSGSAHGLIPRWAWCSWMVVTVIGVSLSIPWVLSHTDSSADMHCMPSQSLLIQSLLLCGMEIGISRLLVFGTDHFEFNK